MHLDLHPPERAKLELFVKTPLGGAELRAIQPILAEHGARVAQQDLATQRKRLRRRAPVVAKDACVLLLGGSNGILRQVAVQLLFAERMPVHAVHYDSAKLQIGPHHARALTDAAREAGVDAAFRNADATRPDVIAAVVAELAQKYRVVHLINGIAAGATKRYAMYGKALVKDLDVAFDPVRQTPDFSRQENVRRLGLVEIDIATQADIDRTNKMMGTSTDPWADALAEAGLLVRDESVVAFADYDFEADDPVYGMGPLAGAKTLARESMKRIREAHGAHTIRICYPPLCTTAIGAIPGGALMFAGSAELLLRDGTFQGLPALAEETMAIFGRDARQSGILRVDTAYQAALPEFHRLCARLTNENVRTELSRVIGVPRHV
jgi:enoyl-[acyl-carrier protein] reductase/trans-2-enoyl-CoA reductase (NAD+)